MSQRSTRRFIYQLSAMLFTLVAAWCLLPARTAHADGITVTVTYPVSNALNITTTTSISAAFTSNINATTVTSRSFAVRGLQGGLVVGTHDVINGNTIIVTPPNAFHAGEVVMVNASSRIESSSGITVTPYVWQFTVDARHGSGDGDYRTEQVVDANFDGPESVYAADVDGDGDLDVLGAAEVADTIAWWENVDQTGPGTGDGTIWSEHSVDADFNWPRSVYAADVDGDGDLDVLGAAYWADDIAWWENVDQTGPGTGDGTAWSEHSVDADFDGARSTYAADMDGDGDLDILGAAIDAADITWWENVDQTGPGTGDGTAWSEHSVDADFDGAYSVYAADVDGDGDLDVLGAAVNSDDIAWWENVDQAGPGTGDGTIWSEHSVDADFDGAASAYAADVDGDGDLDILGAAFNADDIAWWENVDQTGPGTGDGMTWVEHSVDADFDGAHSVYAADVDGDGDLDVHGTAYWADDIAWWENVDHIGPGTGDGTVWVEHSVDADFDGARSVCAADVDDDGDLDVLGAAYYADDIMIWLNEPLPADLVLSKSFMPRAPLPGDVITYTLSFANAGGTAASGVVITDSIPVSVTHSSLSEAHSGALITATGSISYVWQVQDLAPGDGGVITISGVLSNSLGPGISNIATITTTSMDSNLDNNSGLAILPFAVTAVVPARNSLNVTATSNISTAFNIAINTATVTTSTLTARGLQSGIYTGSYSFPVENVALFDPANSFKAGEVVMVSASSQIESNSGITLTPYTWQFTVDARHSGGDGDYRTEQVVDANFDGAASVYAADVDGDGDLDVLGAASLADDIVWWENVDQTGQGTGNGTVWNEHIVDADFDGAWSVCAADVDGDGDLDILGAATIAFDIAWWENVDQTGPGTGDGTAWVEHSVDTTFDGVESVYAADVDGDGDLDVLGAASIADDITWWENVDQAGPGTGNGTVWVEHSVDVDFDRTRSVYVADVDGDGDLDVLGAASSTDDIAWWENVDQTGPGTGDGTAWSEHSVDADSDGVQSVYAADVDGDGDLDVLGAAFYADAIVWWENVDQTGPGTGDGTAWSEHSVDADFDGAYSVYAADADGDGDLDVLGAASIADDIAWWENMDQTGLGTGNGMTWVEHSVDADFNGARSVYAADMDGDGDLDVLGAASSTDDITIWLNEPLPSDLVLSKFVTPHTALPGDTITYTLAFSNSGTLTATQVVITDVVPISITNISVISSGVAITDTGHSPPYVWRVQNLSPGQGGIITITGVLSQSLPAGPFTNTATITTATTEVVTTNNSGAVSVTVQNVAPVLGVIGNQSVAEETELAFTATANDANGDTLSYSLLGAPPGAAINGSSGAFSWTPTEVQGPGDYQVTILVSDTVVTDSETITITVNEVNLAPLLDPVGDQSVDEETELAFIASTTDADIPAQPLSYSLLGAPSGASINSSNGLFSWTPTEVQGPGSYQVTIIVSDTIVTDSETITVTVNEVNLAPVLDPIGNQNVDEETELAFTASATDSDIPTQTLSYSLLGAPSGATINSSSGVFSWTPTEVQGPGDYQMTIIVSDTIVTDSETITITVNEVNLAPVLVPVGNQSVDEETELTFTAIATDADVPTQTLNYSLLGAPTGASINGSSGAFSWTPTEAQGPGDYSATIVVSDTIVTDSETITITVNEVNLAPVLAPIGNQNVDEETELTFTVSATDADGTMPVLGAENLPTGAVFTPTTGAFGWTPGYDAAGSYTVTFSAGDGQYTDTETITITVTNTNRAPVAVDDAYAVPYETTLVVPTATGVLTNDLDADGDPLTAMLDGGPVNGSVTLNADGSFVYTPTAGFSGDDTFTYLVNDSWVNSNVATVTLSVLSPTDVDLAVSKGVSDAAPGEGDAIVYTLMVVNNGPADATGIEVSDPLPAGVTYSSDDGGGAYDGTTWIVGDLAMSVSATLRITVTVDPGTGGTTITNTADISAVDQNDPFGNNDTADAVLTVREEPVNVAPTADAGTDQAVPLASIVTLDGSGSSDPDGDDLTYLWQQTGGTPIVTLSDSAIVSPTFTAPGAPTILTFTLVVTDTLGLSSVPDTVVIAVTEYYIHLPSVLRNY